MRKLWQTFIDWLFALQPVNPPVVNDTKDRSLAGKARVKARKAAANRLRNSL